MFCKYVSEFVACLLILLSGSFTEQYFLVWVPNQKTRERCGISRTSWNLLSGPVKPDRDCLLAEAVGTILIRDTVRHGDISCLALSQNDKEQHMVKRDLFCVELRVAALR